MESMSLAVSTPPEVELLDDEIAAAERLVAQKIQRNSRGTAARRRNQESRGSAATYARGAGPPTRSAAPNDPTLLAVETVSKLLAVLSVLGYAHFGRKLGGAARLLAVLSVSGVGAFGTIGTKPTPLTPAEFRSFGTFGTFNFWHSAGRSAGLPDLLSVLSGAEVSGFEPI